MSDAPPRKPLLDRLGVKPGHRVAVLGVADPAFLKALRARGASVSTRRVKGADLIFYAADRSTDLAKLRALKAGLKRDGALWVVRPKGVREITESQVLAAGLAAGLVDVKVVSFSPTQTAEKFAFRLKDR